MRRWRHCCCPKVEFPRSRRIQRTPRPASRGPLPSSPNELHNNQTRPGSKISDEAKTFVSVAIGRQSRATVTDGNTTAMTAQCIEVSDRNSTTTATMEIATGIADITTATVGATSTRGESGDVSRRASSTRTATNTVTRGEGVRSRTVSQNDPARFPSPLIRLPLVHGRPRHPNSRLRSLASR